VERGKGEKFEASGKNKIVSIKKIDFFFIFIIESGNLVQSFRLRAAITFFFDVAVFLNKNPVDHTAPVITFGETVM